jgi:hypothetical protein
MSANTTPIVQAVQPPLLAFGVNLQQHAQMGTGTVIFLVETGNGSNVQVKLRRVD